MWTEKTAKYLSPDINSYDNFKAKYEGESKSKGNF